MTRWWLVPFLALALQSLTHAQSVCTAADSLRSCESRMAEHLNVQAAKEEESVGAAKEQLQTATHELLAKANTGTVEAVSALPTSTFTDFFPLLKLAAAAPEGGEDDGEVWAFAINRCSPARRQPRAARCQLRGRVGGATLYEPLKQALPEAIRAARASELEDEIGSFDGASVGFFANLENERFGRDLRIAEDPLYDRLLDRARHGSRQQHERARDRKNEVFTFSESRIRESNARKHADNLAAVTAALQEPGPQRVLPANQAELLQTAFSTPPAPGDSSVDGYNRVVAQINDLVDSVGARAALQPLFEPIESDDVPFAEYPEGIGTDVLVMWQKAVTADVEAGRAVLDALRTSGYFDLYRLANNQPQLNFGVEYRAGSRLVGPDEARAKLSWEFGLTNLNDLRQFASPSGTCSKRATDASADARADCLQEYLDDPDVRADLQSGDRFALTVEYLRRKPYDADLPDDNVSLSLDAERAVVGSLAWGRYLSLAGTGAETFGRSRVDLVASYEDVSSDPARQDRGIANLTYSQEVSGGLVLSLAVVYATRPEFRGDVDEEWSSRLGLNYKLAGPPK